VPHGDWNKNAAIMRNLDKMRERIKALESALADAGKRDDTNGGA
jgi:UDP-3-O-[3-hydroxymyristoyl] glucosamine N-acyltransferase